MYSAYQSAKRYFSSCRDYCSQKAKSFVSSTSLIIQSPLVQSSAALALVVKATPVMIGIGSCALSALALKKCHHLLPKSLIYEVAILDLIVRDQLSRLCPFLHQKWWHEINEHILLGGLPLKNFNHDKKLWDLGVRVVVSIVEEEEITKETFLSRAVQPQDWENLGVQQLIISSKDMRPISCENIEKALRFIESHRGKHKIYVHCKGGRERSATIVAADLITSQKMTVVSACDFIRSKRSLAQLRPCQLESLQAYSTSLNAG